MDMENVITRESEVYTEIVSKLQLMEKEVDAMLSVDLSGSDKWIDTSQVLRILDVSKRTLQSYRDNGILPYSKVGGIIYYLKSDLDDLLKANYVAAKQDSRPLTSIIK